MYENGFGGKSILKAQPSDYQGFTFSMSDPNSVKSRGGCSNNSGSGGISHPKHEQGRNNFSDRYDDDSSKHNRRVRLFLESEQTTI